MEALLGCLHHVQTHHHLIGPLRKKRRTMDYLQKPQGFRSATTTLPYMFTTSCHPG